MKKIQSYDIFKITSSKILANELNLNLSLKEARQNEEIVSLGNSQVIRTIHKVLDKEFSEIELRELELKKKMLKRNIKNGVNIEYSKNELFNVLRQIDNILFIPQLVSVVSEKKSQYDKIAKKGFYLNGVLYKRFMCSAGGARTNTAFFLSDDIFDKVVDTLSNGHNKIKIAYAKYNAYFSLSSSATFVVSEPKVCVVPDKEIMMRKMVDWVEEDKNGNDIILTKNVELPFNFWDGMGLISPSQAQVWANDLEIDYLPSAFCVRNAFVKGMVCVFDFHKFAYEIAPTRYITDIWGKKHHIDDIEVILTQSQFKFWQAYNSWQQYLDNTHKNELYWGVSKFTPKIEESSIRTNYQFVQVLDLDDNQIKELCKNTVDWLDGITGFDENYVKLFMLGKLSKHNDINLIWKSIQNNMLKALLLDNNIANDIHITNKILQSMNKKIRESYIGKLFVDGNFQVRIKDPYGLCEHIFGMEVNGLLNDNEHYCKFWSDKNIHQVVAMRSPLTWKSEAHKLTLKNTNEMQEWYKYINSGIIYNIWGCDDMLEADAD